MSDYNIEKIKKSGSKSVIFNTKADSLPQF